MGHLIGHIRFPMSNCTDSEILSLISENLKRSRDSENNLSRVIYYACISTPSQLGVVCHPKASTWHFYSHTKFVDSRFSRSGDTFSGIEIENLLYDFDHAPFRGGLWSKS